MGQNDLAALPLGTVPGGKIPELSAMMPAYNEEEILPTALAEAVEALEAQVTTWELIVVDDGSTDRTPQILAEWCEREPRLRVVTNSPNIGYSRALIRGFEACRLTVLFYTDGDAQFDLMEIGKLSNIADYFVICTGQTDRQLDAIVREVRAQLKQEDQQPAGIEGKPLSGWVLVDCGDVVLHAFSPAQREFYRLERLWSAAKTILRVA